MFGMCAVSACDSPATLRVLTRHPAWSGHTTTDTDSLLCQRHADMVTSWGDHGGSYEYVVQQCEAFWPSAVSGAWADAQCVNDATTNLNGEWLCRRCANLSGE